MDYIGNLTSDFHTIPIIVIEVITLKTEVENQFVLLFSRRDFGSKFFYPFKIKTKTQISPKLMIIVRFTTIVTNF